MPNRKTDIRTVLATMLDWTIGISFVIVIPVMILIGVSQ